MHITLNELGFANRLQCTMQLGIANAEPQCLEQNLLLLNLQMLVEFTNRITIGSNHILEASYKPMRGALYQHQCGSQ